MKGQRDMMLAVYQKTHNPPIPCTCVKGQYVQSEMCGVQLQACNSIQQGSFSLHKKMYLKGWPCCCLARLEPQKEQHFQSPGPWNSEEYCRNLQAASCIKMLVAKSDFQSQNGQEPNTVCDIVYLAASCRHVTSHIPVCNSTCTQSEACSSWLCPAAKNDQIVVLKLSLDCTSTEATDVFIWQKALHQLCLALSSQDTELTGKATWHQVKLLLSSSERRQVCGQTK